MGVIKRLIFDGVNTLNYNIGITGEAVYNSPERDVEMIEIAGRNGAFALDRGRFRNIEVTYPAGAFDTDQYDFALKMSALRNELSSRVGYKRLEDEYNLSEYRLAVYKSGLEVSPVAMSKAGQFNIIFDCKPQRFLKSGDTAQAITSGDTIINPTLFESSPLIEAKGYGDININSDTLSIENVPIGEIVLFSGTGWQTLTSATFSDSSLETGDTITMSGGSSVTQTFTIENTYVVESVTAATIGGTNPEIIRAVNVSTTEGAVIIVTWDLNPITFTKGTVSNLSASVSFSWTYHTTSAPNTHITQAENLTLDVKFNSPYSGWSRVQMLASGAVHYLYALKERLKFETIKGNSTKPASNAPIYIDLDIGEAYTIVNSEPVSANNIVSIPAELPTLKSGNNTITFDNTITSLKITPRWWKV